jgi:RNA polymerase sigma-70 factor (ECF subfamily)
VIDNVTLMTRFGVLGTTRKCRLQSLNDCALIEQFLRHRDVDVFDILVHRYRDRIFALATSVLGRSSASEAEDATQEVFIVVYKQLETFRGDAAFSTWLYRVARNQIAGFRRRPGNRVVVGTDDGMLALADTNKQTDPLTVVANGEAQDRLLRVIDRLPESQRLIVHLFYWQDQSVSEIATLLEMEPNTVKSHLRRARIGLAGRLQESDLEI